MPVAENAENSIDTKFAAMMNSITTLYRNCEDSQQRMNLIAELQSIVDTYSPVPLDDIEMPEEVITKGRPKGTKGSRLWSAFEKRRSERRAKEVEPKQQPQVMNEHQNEEQKITVKEEKQKKRRYEQLCEIDELWPKRKITEKIPLRWSRGM